MSISPLLIWPHRCAHLRSISTAHYAINELQNANIATANGYACNNLSDESNSDSFVIALAVSGGGYRAVAMAHDVMTRSFEIPIFWEGRHRSLLDGVDLGQKTR